MLPMLGGRDSKVSSISDMQSVQDAATEGEMWVLGLAGQCADDYMPVAPPGMVRWSVCTMQGAPAAACFRN